MDGSVYVRGLGDANGDHHTDIAEFAILAAHFNQPAQSYPTGDFDLNGTAEIADFGSAV